MGHVRARMYLFKINIRNCENVKIKEKKKNQNIGGAELRKKKIFIVYGYKYKLLRLLNVDVLMCEQNLVGR